MNDHKDDEIDLIALLKTVFAARRFVIKITVFFLFLGIILALVSPVRYSASSTFMPQLSETQSNTPFSGLASLAGVNLTAIMGGQPQEIAQSLYPQIAESSPYLKALLETPVGESQISFRDYILDEKEGESIIGLIKKYTIGLPRLLFYSNRSEPTSPSNNFFDISEEDRDLFEVINHVLSVEVDDQGPSFYQCDFPTERLQHNLQKQQQICYKIKSSRLKVKALETTCSLFKPNMT